MKTVTNQQTKIKSEDKLLTRGDLLKVVINSIPERGLTVTSMRDRIRILDIIEKADTEDIILEDADFKQIKKLYDDYQWAGLNKDVIELADHLEELSKTK